MGVYNQQDLADYIQQHSPKVQDRKIYVITNDVGEVLDIGKRHGQFGSKSGAVQALNRFVGNKIKWYEYEMKIPSIQKLSSSMFRDEIKEMADFLLSNKLIVITEMII
jgi:hypothetical protein